MEVYSNYPEEWKQSNENSKNRKNQMETVTPPSITYIFLVILYS